MTAIVYDFTEIAKRAQPPSLVQRKAVDVSLDATGMLYGIYRWHGEKDEHFRQRIQEYVNHKGKAQ